MAEDIVARLRDGLCVANGTVGGRRIDYHETVALMAQGAAEIESARARAEAAEASLAQGTKERDEAQRLLTLHQDLTRPMVDRWNIERQEGGDLLVCQNNHEKGDGCEYERWIPAARAEVLQAEVGRLREKLQDIADGRGVCGTCGAPATGPGAGYTACGCSYPIWEHQDPAKIAIAALNHKDPA